MIASAKKWWPLSGKKSTEISIADLNLVKQINAKYEKLHKETNQQIQDRFQALKPIAEKLYEDEITKPTDQLLSEAFACIKQAGWRAIKMAHHDVQLLAGITMARGGVAEMATGEGKTLVATLPSSVFALWGKGVHVMTVNGYLAQRDYEIMEPVYELLGLNAGYVATKMSDEEKTTAYLGDITYSVGNDFGFDYLRDQLKLHQSPKPRLGESYQSHLRGNTIQRPIPVQRGHAFAVIDEADSVMIDEANSALILSGSSGQAHKHPAPYKLATKIISVMEEGEDYMVEEIGKRVSISKQGLEMAMEKLDRDTRLTLVRPWEIYISKAIFAKHYSIKDVDYIIKDESIQIIDASTGRRFEDRSWSEGLHQAVESKEQVTITEESASMLKMSRQRFFRLYQRGCGMTGTAVGCEDEMLKFFDMKVKKIPLHKESKRIVKNMKFFETKEDKWNNIIVLTKEIQQTGMPVLIGTQSVMESEKLAETLKHSNLSCQVLNARHDAEEAELVNLAGLKGAITVATNMAGRGTDIPINDEVKKLGGLFVILTEPHLSHRVDRQLIGRCARQGMPGMAISFACKEDELFDIGEFTNWESLKTKNAWDPLKVKEKIESIQAKLDLNAYHSRQNLMQTDKWREELLSKLS